MQMVDVVQTFSMHIVQEILVGHFIVMKIVATVEIQLTIKIHNHQRNMIFLLMQIVWE